MVNICELYVTYGVHMWQIMNIGDIMSVSQSCMAYGDKRLYIMNIGDTL